MNAVRERPRVGIAIGLAVLVVLIGAVLIGASISGGSDASAGSHTATQTGAGRAQLMALTRRLQARDDQLASKSHAVDQWRARALAAEQRLSQGAHQDHAKTSDHTADDQHTKAPKADHHEQHHNGGGQRSRHKGGHDKKHKAE